MAKIILFFKKHKKISLAAALILAAGVYFVFKPGQGDVAKIVYSYGTASRGAIVQSVSGTGQISAARQSDLKSKVSGEVLEVKVSAGEAVKAGDTIARIDDSDARAAVADARAALENVQLSLEKLNEPVDELSLLQARNSLVQAEESLASDKEDLDKKYEQGFNSVAAAFVSLPSILAGLQDLVTGASSFVTQFSPTYVDYYAESIKAYDAQAPELMVGAANSYQKAKMKYDQNFQAYKSASQFSNQEQIEALIKQTYETARVVAEALKQSNTLVQRYQDVLYDQNLTPQNFSSTHLNSLSGYITKNNSLLNDLLSASENIVSAKNAIVSDERAIDEKTKSLANLNEGPEEIDLKSQQLAVEQKKRALASAVEALGDYTIRAPFDGVIASVDIEKGDEIAANAAAATVITDNQIATITLNEIDIAKVKVGQKATLSFSAVEGLTAAGKVAQVDAIGSVSQGVVSYGVTIALDSENESVKSGMSITATIITEMKQDVLMVPSAAVRTDDQGSYVLAPAAGGVDSVEQRPVVAGLSDDTNVEIVEGLNEGDQVVVSSSKTSVSKTSTQSPASRSSGGSMFNIGGMGGPMR